MGEDAPKVNEAYSQMKIFLEQAKEESDLKTKILLMEKDLENFVKDTKISEMIKKAIEEHDQSANKNKIQWGPIIQAVIIALIVGGVMRGFQ